MFLFIVVHLQMCSYNSPFIQFIAKSHEDKLQCVKIMSNKLISDVEEIELVACFILILVESG